jgi:hypothetical protein
MMLYGNYTIKYMKRVLVACEESQIVTKAFRELGHEAYSCDILPCSGGHPEWHFQQDVFEVIDNKHWDIIILHPPCTKVAVSGNAWYGSNKARHNERVESVKWIQSLWDKSISLCEKVAMENPVGVLNKMGNFPKPTYIQPWQFGHGETKKTGLWLKGLPNLKPTNIVKGREQRIWKMPPSKDRGKLRSKTFLGIAKAIAEQWGNYA